MNMRVFIAMVILFSASSIEYVSSNLQNPIHTNHGHKLSKKFKSQMYFNTRQQNEQTDLASKNHAQHKILPFSKLKSIIARSNKNQKILPPLKQQQNFFSVNSINQKFTEFNHIIKKSQLQIFFIQQSYILNQQILSSIKNRKSYQKQFGRQISTQRILQNDANASQRQFIDVSFSNLEYIKNGNFSVNTCPSGSQWCIWSPAQTNVTRISNWNATNGIEIGNGNLYSPLLSSTRRVIQLILSEPTCIFQNVLVPTGIFNLTYFYTAKSIVPTNYSTFLVFVNNIKFQEIIQLNYSINKYTTQIKNYIQGANLQIKFCGKSWTSTPYGAILLNASLIKVGEVQFQILNSDTFNTTLQATVELDFLEFVNKIPGSRRLFNQFLTFMVNIDHLWLYIYHQRNYGKPITTLLESINALQNQKWQYFKQDVIQAKIGFNETKMSQSIDYKKKYASTSFSEIENTGSSFLVNNVRFFLTNTVFVTIFFLIGKCIYRSFMGYRISTYFQQYSSNIYLVIMLLFGNVESFSYYFASDCTKLFSFNFSVKILNNFTLLMFFCFLFIVSTGYFLLLGFCRNQSRHLYDNCKASKKSCFYLFVQNGLFNIILGMIHLIFQQSSQIQLLLLSLTQGCYISFLVYFLANSRIIFQYKYLFWINVVTSFMRILLILTFQWFDVYSLKSVTIIQNSQQIIIIIYLSIWVMSFIISIMIPIKRICFTKMKKIKNESKKSRRVEPINKKIDNLFKIQQTNRQQKISKIDPIKATKIQRNIQTTKLSLSKTTKIKVQDLKEIQQQQPNKQRHKTTTKRRQKPYNFIRFPRNNIRINLQIQSNINRQQQQSRIQQQKRQISIINHNNNGKKHKVFKNYNFYV